MNFIIGDSEPLLYALVAFIVTLAAREIWEIKYSSFYFTSYSSLLLITSLFYNGSGFSIINISSLLLYTTLIVLDFRFRTKEGYDSFIKDVINFHGGGFIGFAVVGGVIHFLDLDSRYVFAFFYGSISFLVCYFFCVVTDKLTNRVW